MAAPQLAPGQVLAGKYSIRAVMGNGGSSMTYQAVDAQNADIVIKIYDPTIAQHQNVMAGLEQAYAATNALPQSTVGPIIDAGYEATTAAPFSVTPKIPYPNLAAANRRLNIEETIMLLRGMAASVDAAHARGVAHAALKPTNVFFGPTINPVVVTDFGASLAKGAISTQEGFSLSAPWIAPEQAQGGAAVGPAADVFTAGLVAYFALTGRSYWRSCTTATPDVAQWQQELVGQRMPFSSRAAEMGVAFSPNVDPVMWKALSVNPAERYQSLTELANALTEALHRTAAPAPQPAAPVYEPPPEPVIAPAAPAPQPPPPPPPPRRRDNPTPVVPIIIGVLVVALLAGIVAVWLIQEDKPEPTGPIAVAASAEVEPEVEEEPEIEIVPDNAKVSILCEPKCDVVTINGTQIKIDQELRLETGDYDVEASAEGYKPVKETISVVAGKDLDKKFTLEKVVGTWKKPPPTEPECGKFMKRCPK